MSHHGDLACDANVSWRSARVARAQAICGPPLDSPPGEKSQGNLDALTVTMMSHHRLLACDVIDCGRLALRSARACARHGPPLGSPLGEISLSRVRHEVIMIKTKSTQVSGRRASRASEARVASWQPFGDNSGCNHDAIMIRMMSHQWHSASDELVGGLSRRAWYVSEAWVTPRQSPRCASQDLITMQS